MTQMSSDPLWFKHAIIYQLHVKSFFDANNDGIGDFPGLIQKLDYLKDLGVSALWLLPFYPSPLRDDGYDIGDYRGINPQYGTMRDFRVFVREAHRRGLKVITELVINHTSDQHPWFQRARRAPRGSRYRDWYVWSDDDKRWPETRIIFTDTESSNWTWDPVAGQYYWHRFFSHQPDLNFDNPRVVQAVIDVMRFWLDMGVDGLRLDAIPYLVERDGTHNENLPETHAVIKQLRAAMDESHPHAFFLAEANQWPEDARAYFGDGDECQMAFHFPLMPRMYMAMAQEDRHPITDIMRQTPAIPENCQWAIFLRNHDELTLEMVTERERDYMWRFYAADSRARINLGIRRRLAALMENDRRKIELMNSLLFSMPGTPIIYYGDEIGMGDNIFLGDRDGVRTPMQWSPDRNGGFSRADPASLYLPPIMNSIFGFDAVNVEAQARSTTSQLNWMRRMIAVRQRHPAFGGSNLTFLYPGNRKILAYLLEETQEEEGGETVLCVANLSRQAQPVELDLARFRGRVPYEMLAGSPFPPIGELTYLLTLPPYAFYWFLLTEGGEPPVWHRALPEPLPDLVTLVWSRDWASLSHGQNTEFLARDSLPAFVGNQRWFAGKGARVKGIRVLGGAQIPSSGEPLYFAMIEVAFTDNREPHRYCLPLALLWDEAAVTTLSPLLPFTLAKVRRGAKLGALVDATIDPQFGLSLIDCMRSGARLKTDHGSINFKAGTGLAEIPIEPEDEIRRLGVEQSNSSVLIGEKMVLKVFRKLSSGAHPELEIGRFLTDVAKFAHVPAVLGEVEHLSDEGVPTALAVLQAFVRNQGDGWSYTLEYLQRELEEALLAEDDGMEAAERFAVYGGLAATLGQRTAEMHRALALTTGDPGFDPEPLNDADISGIVDGLRAQVEKAFHAVASIVGRAEPKAAGAAAELVGRRDEVLDKIDRFANLHFDAAKTRHHGDFHLGQVLVTKTDFVFVDFEGEPERGLEERQAKRSPLRDVAGMLRSFDYAAAAAVRQRDDAEADSSDRALDLARAWRDLSVQEYLKAYRQTIEGCISWPGDPAAAAALLDIFTLEKALYEIGYEAANRPAWLDIPIGGVISIIDADADQLTTGDA